jgi:hypothetical protein
MTAIEAASIKYFCLYSEASFDIDKWVITTEKLSNKSPTIRIFQIS